MTRPWLVVLWLAAAALLASAWGWHARRDAWQPPPALAPQLPSLVALPAPEAAPMRVSLARPLLWPARRPIEQGAAKNGPESELAKARLLAVVSSGKEWIALLARPDGSALKLTTQTRPWRIEAFDGRNATFVRQDGGQRVERPLEHAAPSSPAASAPPPAARAAQKR